MTRADRLYTVSSIRILDDLKAGRRPTTYRVSSRHLLSPEWLHEHYFDKGDGMVADGLFELERTAKGCQLR